MILKTYFVFEFVLFKDDDLVAPFFSAVRMVHTALYTDVPIFADIETVDPDTPFVSGEGDKGLSLPLQRAEWRWRTGVRRFYVRDLGRDLVRRRAYRRV